MTLADFNGHPEVAAAQGHFGPFDPLHKYAVSDSVNAMTSVATRKKAMGWRSTRRT